MTLLEKPLQQTMQLMLLQVLFLLSMALYMAVAKTDMCAEVLK